MNEKYSQQIIINNEDDYNQFVDYLKSLSDNKYKQFHQSLVLTSKYEILGIRTPIMRSIAAIISKGNIESYLKYAKDTYYEEVMIQGLVISKIKDETVFDTYFHKHIKKIDNWALCDTFCSSIKQILKKPEKYFKEATILALKKDEYLSRVGLVMILDYFVEKECIEKIFNILNQIESNKFYINMAEAWLVCELYIKYPIETEVFLSNNKLNKFTQNKAISKINDSYRVSKEDKNKLKTYRK